MPVLLNRVTAQPGVVVLHRKSRRKRKTVILALIQNIGLDLEVCTVVLLLFSSAYGITYRRWDAGSKSISLIHQHLSKSRCRNKSKKQKEVKKTNMPLSNFYNSASETERAPSA